ncbi:MAG TPA: hypothetical protein VFF98_14225, partial [Novosphingobium sp.]|nr:hypothetical protein [Novosphingobium sp.]
AIADPMYSILSTRNAHTRVTGIYLASSLAALALAWLLTRWHASMVEVAACVVLAELSNLLAGYYFAARMFRMPLNRFVPSLLRLGAQRLKSMPGSVKRKLQANGQAS